ncbi:hypothetical protein B0T17DRAFT_537055 [Bombardia bombarda]|uniref:Golgi apparatus membrane protein TVP38 n=1 Tax=Bombardia bombarda TaxID=252184 RepID=A0AA39WMT8_9PEZI|nr:hypothetical protein B0T17DRAFT_537055 [Bombardia bombarda]
MQHCSTTSRRQGGTKYSELNNHKLLIITTATTRTVWEYLHREDCFNGHGKVAIAVPHELSLVNGLSFSCILSSLSSSPLILLSPYLNGRPIELHPSHTIPYPTPTPQNHPRRDATMPAADEDYRSAAAALSISPIPSPRPSDSSSQQRPLPFPDISDSPDRTASASPPSWGRGPSTSSMRRLSTRPPYNRSLASQQQADQPWTERLLATATAVSQKAWDFFWSLTPLQQGLLALAGAAVFILSVVGLVYSHRIFAALQPVAKQWRELPGGWVILWLMCFMTSFPPVIGYSTTVSIAGFVYGFPGGWPIVASATVAGSTVAFFTSRGIFSGYVHRLVGTDKRFVALGQVLRRDGVAVLVMIRLCPLPYSLSNGFLATVPSIRPWSFAMATALATPKLAVHVFIGSRLALLVNSDDTMSPADRAINYISIFVGIIIGIGVSLLIYRRTMARAAELALEEGDDILSTDGAGDNNNYDYDEDEDLDGRRRNSNSQLMMDPDVAALMNDDDDISLWDTDAGYRDSWDEEAAVGGDNGGDAKKLNGTR